MLLEDEHRAVRHRLAVARRLHRHRVGPQVAHLVDVGTVHGLVHRERRLVVLGKRDPRLHQRRQRLGTRRHRARLQAAEVGGDIDDVVVAQLRRHRVHQRVLARARLQGPQLRFEVRAPLSRQVRDVVGDADAVGAVAGRADHIHSRLARREVGAGRGRLREGRRGKEGQGRRGAKGRLHRITPWPGLSAGRMQELCGLGAPKRWRGNPDRQLTACCPARGELLVAIATFRSNLCKLSLHGLVERPVGKAQNLLPSPRADPHPGDRAWPCRRSPPPSPSSSR